MPSTLEHVPLFAYIRAPEPWGRPVWKPRWRVWRWVLAAMLVAYAAARADGAVGILLVFVVFGLVCQALAEALPYGRGLTEWRQ